MKPVSTQRWTFMACLALLLLAPSWASARVRFGRIVVFGTSLSDPGNAFALTGMQSTPPYNTLDKFLIPDAPYARGGHHFTNGATWVEQFARPLGLAENVRPAFQGSNTEATNYAVGGARARDDGSTVNLSEQVGDFLTDFHDKAPSDALYVVEMGSNDVQDALADPPEATAIINAALTAIGDNIGTLYAAGAREFLVLNVPNLGLTPAVRSSGSGAESAANSLAVSFNLGLNGTLSGLAATLPAIQIVPFDFYSEANTLVANPEAFGLSDVEDACVTPNMPPFACQMPDEFLFWDGIHPTAAVHAILAQQAATALAQYGDEVSMSGPALH